MEQSYIAVVGGVNIDISGTCATAMIPADSNPGRVTSALGGVGRNIAENIARLGRRTALVTVLGDDHGAQRIQESCQALGIDLSASVILPDHRTSTYLCINDANGEMAAAVNDMDIYERLTPEVLGVRMDFLNRAALVVADANLPGETITFLAERCTAPLMMDPVSGKKAPRCQGVLHALAAFKPNRLEAELLSGLAIASQAALPAVGDWFLARGVRRLFLSLGSQGVYYQDGCQRGIEPCAAGPVVNTTGCGDAFMAAAAVGLADGLGIRAMARAGQAAAAICAAWPGAVSPEMSWEALRQKMNDGRNDPCS